MRECSECAKTFPLAAEFFEPNPYGFRRKCRLCRNAYKKRLDLQVRIDVLTHYGNLTCACCGESELAFLTLDHINGGGTREHRETGLWGNAYYRWLQNVGYPTGLQVLCFNCNCSKGAGGTCWHQRQTLTLP